MVNCDQNIIFKAFLKKKEYGLKNNTTKKIQALFLKNQNKRFNHKI